MGLGTTVNYDGLGFSVRGLQQGSDRPATRAWVGAVPTHRPARHHRPDAWSRCDHLKRVTPNGHPLLWVCAMWTGQTAKKRGSWRRWGDDSAWLKRCTTAAWKVLWLRNALRACRTQSGPLGVVQSRGVGSTYATARTPLHRTKTVASHRTWERRWPGLSGPRLPLVLTWLNKDVPLHRAGEGAAPPRVNGTARR